MKLCGICDKTFSDRGYKIHKKRVHKSDFLLYLMAGLIVGTMIYILYFVCLVDFMGGFSY